MKNYLNDQIFPSFLTSAEVEGIDNEGLLIELYQIKQADPLGVEKSNANDGIVMYSITNQGIRKT